MSIRSTAARRLGLPRGPDLASLRRQQGQQQPQQSGRHNALDDDYFDSDEEEEERILSEPHGETEDADDNTAVAAADSTTSVNGKRKRQQAKTDEEIAAEYDKQARNGGSSQNDKSRRIRRRMFDEHDLIKPNGLSAIFTNFPQTLNLQLDANQPHSSNNNSNHSPGEYGNNLQDMARFSRKLMSAYRQWADKLQPGVPFDDVLWKVHELGSRGIVKQHLITMRNQVRNAYVERIYGLEKAEQLLAQLDAGLQYEDDRLYDNMEDAALESNVAEHEDSSEHATETSQYREGDGDEISPADRHPDTSTGNALTSTAPTDVIGNAVTPSASPAASLAHLGARKIARQRSQHALQDSSDEEEEELTFESSPTSNQGRSALRAVLDDSDDDEENELEFEDNAQPAKPTDNATEERSLDAPQGTENNDPLPSMTNLELEHSVRTAQFTSTSRNSARRAILDDSDDEENELEFEDDTEAVKLVTDQPSTDPSPTSPEDSLTLKDVHATSSAVKGNELDGDDVTVAVDAAVMNNAASQGDLEPTQNNNANKEANEHEWAHSSQGQGAATLPTSTSDLETVTRLD